MEKHDSSFLLGGMARVGAVFYGPGCTVLLTNEATTEGVSNGTLWIAFYNGNRQNSVRNWSDLCLWSAHASRDDKIEEANRIDAIVTHSGTKKYFVGHQLFNFSHLKNHSVIFTQ